MINLILLIIVIVLLYKLLKRVSIDEVFEEPKRDLPYHFKQYFFSRSEQDFFNILNAHIDARRYTVFPKVRLGDFVQVNGAERRNRTWWNKIRAKHVDFLIWDLREKKIVVAIELDGNSHNSNHMKERDDFVNELYEKIELKLVRVRVGTSFKNACSEIGALLES